MMCGRLSQYTGLHGLVDVLSTSNVLVNPIGEQPERYNVAPSTQVIALRLEGDTLITQSIRWGWRPFWARDYVAPISARVEKVAHGRFFGVTQRHRALCSVSGWFEWVVEDGLRRRLYHIRRANSPSVLCVAVSQFPGLDDEPEEQRKFVIAIVDSAGGLIDIHSRRPVVLSPELTRKWLGPAASPGRAEEIVLTQGEPNEVFTWYAISPAVGNVRNQGVYLIEPQHSASQAATPAPVTIHPSGECTVSQIDMSAV